MTSDARRAPLGSEPSARCSPSSLVSRSPLAARERERTHFSSHKTLYTPLHTHTYASICTYYTRGWLSTMRMRLRAPLICIRHAYISPRAREKSQSNFSPPPPLVAPRASSFSSVRVCVCVSLKNPPPPLLRHTSIPIYPPTARLPPWPPLNTPHRTTAAAADQT